MKSGRLPDRRRRHLLLNLFFALLMLPGLRAFALEGMIGIHDPSTVIKCDGTYYVFGTGRGIPILVSSNGFDWQRGGRVFDRIPDSVKSYVPKNDGFNVWAPDIIHLHNQYCLYYAVSSWGSFVSAVGLLTSPTLDTNRPDYHWTDRGMVVHSVEGEELNAIDPGVCLAPDGRLWLCYGSYHGNIQLVQLNPRTGLRIKPDSKVWIIASRSEASDIIYHEGYYYLFVNHGSCCQGADSTYNIRVGRSKEITGPYLDRYGEDLARGAGTLFLASQGRDLGPGHFGLLLDDGVEKFSCHYEAETGRPGRSILAIQPLLWTLDGWPQPGENVPDGIYQIRSQRTGDVLQAAVNHPAQMAQYLVHDNQKWAITPAGGGFYTIVSVQSGSGLAAADAAVNVAPFTLSDRQLWKIDQLTDGSFRIASKAGSLALTAMSHAAPDNETALQTFTGDDAQRWVIATP